MVLCEQAPQPQVARRLAIRQMGRDLAGSPAIRRARVKLFLRELLQRLANDAIATVVLRDQCATALAIHDSSLLTSASPRRSGAPARYAGARWGWRRDPPAARQRRRWAAGCARRRRASYG